MTAIENTFTLDVPSTTQNLALIREFVTRVAEQAGLNETEVGQLELAVELGLARRGCHGLEVFQCCAEPAGDLGEPAPAMRSSSKARRT